MPSIPKPKKITMCQVWKRDDGSKTQGLKRNNGLGKEDLIKNKRGKIVSKAASERGQQAFQGSDLEKWTKCVSQAKKDLGLTGMVCITAGTAGYDRAWEYWEGSRRLPASI